MNLIALSIALAIFLSVALVSAAGLIVSDVVAPDVTPGGETQLAIGIENTFEHDVEDISLVLNFRDTPLSAVGSTEATIEEIEEDENEDIFFRVRAAPTAKPGDYQIPFIITYKQGNLTQTKTGAISVRVKGTVELSASLATSTPVVSKPDRLSVKIINKGFADARYVTVRLASTDLVLRSDEVVYIGDISANDFETATFNIRHTDKKPLVSIIIEYRDFNNTLQTLTVREEVMVYSEEEAVKRGIIERSKTPLYIGVVVVLLVLWIVWRIVRKRRRLRKSKQSMPSS